jgi:hypothetical protein
MARVARIAGVLPLIGAVACAAALAGAAVFTVSQAGCADAGHYVVNGNVVELVGSCVDKQDFPGAKDAATGVRP